MDANGREFGKKGERMMKCHDYPDMDLLSFHSRSFASIRGWFAGLKKESFRTLHRKKQDEKSGI
jgi:hypothetical protein